MDKQKIKRNKIPARRMLCYGLLISFIITFNLFFGLFVWNTHDFAPNQAIGFISILMITLIIYNWKKDLLLQSSDLDKPKNQKV